MGAVLVGQLDISVSGPLKPTVFLMFLFTIGYEGLYAVSTETGRSFCSAGKEVTA